MFLKIFGLLRFKLFELIVSVCLFLSVLLVKVENFGMVFLCFYIEILFGSLILSILRLYLVFFLFVGIVVSICFNCCFFSNLLFSK